MSWGDLFASLADTVIQVGVDKALSGNGGGGGSTVVTTSSNSSSDVSVDPQITTINLVDLGDLAEVAEKFRVDQAEAEQTKQEDLRLLISGGALLFALARN